MSLPLRSMPSLSYPIQKTPNNLTFQAPYSIIGHPICFAHSYTRCYVSQESQEDKQIQSLSETLEGKHFEFMGFILVNGWDSNRIRIFVCSTNRTRRLLGTGAWKDSSFLRPSSVLRRVIYRHGV